MCDEDVYVGWIKELIWSGSRKPGLVRLELKTGGETRSPYFRSLAPPFLCDSYLQSLFWPKLINTGGGGVCFTFKHFHGLVLFDQILRVHWIKPVCQREIWVRLRFHFSFPLVGVAFTGSAAAGKSKKLCVCTRSLQCSLSCVSARKASWGRGVLFLLRSLVPSLWGKDRALHDWRFVADLSTYVTG